MSRRRNNAAKWLLAVLLICAPIIMIVIGIAAAMIERLVQLAG